MLVAGCRASRLAPESAGGVRFALPVWRERGRQVSPSAGFVERAEKDSRVLLSWDVDARTQVPDAALASAATGVVLANDGTGAAGEVTSAQVTRAQVAGHDAIQLGDRALVWRCDKTQRLLRLVREGPGAPPLAELARQLDCHPGPAPRGEVPNVSIAALSAQWRLAHRGNAAAAYLRDDAVLTLFAGQQLPVPHDAHGAEAWAQAAGLSSAVAGSARASEGPQGHNALRVQGTGKLGGAQVRWTLFVWRCIQRQRTFAALVFAHPPDAPPPGDFTGHDTALFAARCHGG